jgi:hypothetical protein
MIQHKWERRDEDLGWVTLVAVCTNKHCGAQLIMSGGHTTPSRVIYVPGCVQVDLSDEE